MRLSIMLFVILFSLVSSAAGVAQEKTPGEIATDRILFRYWAAKKMGKTPDEFFARWLQPRDRELFRRDFAKAKEVGQVRVSRWKKGLTLQVGKKGWHVEFVDAAAGKVVVNGLPWKFDYKKPLHPQAAALGKALSGLRAKGPKSSHSLFELFLPAAMAKGAEGPPPGAEPGAGAPDGPGRPGGSDGGGLGTRLERIIDDLIGDTIAGMGDAIAEESNAVLETNYQENCEVYVAQRIAAGLSIPVGQEKCARSKAAQASDANEFFSINTYCENGLVKGVLDVKDPEAQKYFDGAKKVYVTGYSLPRGPVNLQFGLLGAPVFEEVIKQPRTYPDLVREMPVEDGGSSPLKLCKKQNSCNAVEEASRIGQMMERLRVAVGNKQGQCLREVRDNLQDWNPFNNDNDLPSEFDVHNMRSIDLTNGGRNSKAGEGPGAAPGKTGFD